MSNKNSTTPIQVHHFNVQDAIEYGVEKAVLKYNIEFWLAHNRANNTNFHDGHWWTYNSAEAFQLLIPYMNSKKISSNSKNNNNDVNLKHIINNTINRSRNNNRNHRINKNNKSKR